MVAALYIDAQRGPTTHDLRVLLEAAAACDSYDGWAPHSLAERMAAKRLVAQGLLAPAGVAVCMDCDTAKHRAEPTEVEIYVPTDSGWQIAET